MAVYPRSVANARSSISPTGIAQTVDIQTWTEQATEALLHTRIFATSGVPAATVALAIPIEEQAGNTALENSPRLHKAACEPRCEPVRRDSLKRREDLLKGKEGSRRRQRWENDRLVNNPWAQAPLPSDWEVHPTHPKLIVPYYLAPLWDAEMAARREVEQKKRNSRKGHEEDETAGRVPKELREKLKRQKAAKGLLKDLEEEVRKFVKCWEKKEKELEKEGLHDVDSDEDEIVFVGKNGRMHDEKGEEEEEEEEVRKEKLVFDSLADDHGAGFGRWLVHSIATYYGLRTWSVTVGDPARREAYVGIKPMKTGRIPILTGRGLPCPLYGII